MLLTPIKSPKYLPGVLPDLAQHPLASAADATLPWHPRALVDRLKPQQQQPQQGIRQPSAVPVAGAGAMPRKATPTGLASSSNNSSSVQGGRVPLPSTALYWHQLPVTEPGKGWGFIEPWLFALVMDHRA